MHSHFSLKVASFLCTSCMPKSVNIECDRQVNEKITSDERTVILD